jgi:hypothetical protein
VLLGHRERIYRVVLLGHRERIYKVVLLGHRERIYRVYECEIFPNFTFT